MTLLFTHPDCLEHTPGQLHPEHPARLAAIMKALEDDAFAALDRREAPLASVEQIARAHPMSHVERVLAAVPESGLVAIDGDTAMSPGSGDAARRAAGAVCAAVDAVLGGEAKTAFCAVRPPGHHAEPEIAMGFCLFNSVAVAARHAQAVHGLERVAIVDFDVHHGNGTQAIFEADGSVFYASLHQSPLYPGTGAGHERGVGNIVNVPLAPMASGVELRRALGEVIGPALLDFKPELLIISAGFDAHEDDPLASLRFTDDDYAWATRELLRLADIACDGKVVSALEGGYDLDALARSTAIHVRTLMQAG